MKILTIQRKTSLITDVDNFLHLFTEVLLCFAIDLSSPLPQTNNFLN